jgi:hypothetical protein
MEKGRVTRITSAVTEVEQHITRVPVIGELRISTPDQCPRCRSRRKTLVVSLGWICTRCFDQCKEEAERLVVERNAVRRIPEAYKRAIRVYSEMSGCTARSGSVGLATAGAGTARAARA